LGIASSFSGEGQGSRREPGVTKLQWLQQSFVKQAVVKSVFDADRIA
jgi:hypothetical protein